MSCWKNYWATCFQQLTTYIYKKKERKKYSRSSHLDGKREIACFVITRDSRRADGVKVSVGYLFFSSS